MKLYINEDFESTTSIGTEFNPPIELLNVLPDAVQDLSQYGGAVPVADTYVSSPYENLEALGMLFTVASNDIHTIHVNACGKDFMRLHLDADELYKQLAEYADTCFEMCCEDGHFINSINDAAEILKDRYTPVESGVSYELVEGVQKIIDILNFVVHNKSYYCVKKI
jgi:DNA-binding ferritin-like protein